MENYLFSPPFDVLSPTERQTLAAHSRVVYLDKDVAVPTEWRGDFFVILKGKVKETSGDELVSGLHAQDWFDTKSATTFTPSEQTLLLRIDGAVLADVVEKNATLKNLLFADLSARVSTRNLRHSGQMGQNLLHSAVKELAEYIKPPVFVSASDSVFSAVVQMNRVKAKHVLVKDGDSVGMFTQADVCRAIGDEMDLYATPVGAYSCFALKSITPHTDVSDALLLMLGHKIHRLPIYENGEVTGVLGQSELLGYLAHHSELIVARIEQACDLDELGVAVAMIGKFIRNQHQNGTKTYVISRMVQSLNLHVFEKVWRMITPMEVQENTCVIVMGSEGRGEQIMRTDQDNALIIKDGYQHPELPLFAERFNDALDTLGYPYCTGGIMMKEPRWRLTLSDFKMQVDDWVKKGAGEPMMWLSVLMDGAVVCGDETLFLALSEHLHLSVGQGESGFVNRFAKAAILFGDGHSFWQKFTGGHDSDIDLKKAGIFPIVHGVRALSLEHGVMASSTKDRLQSLSDKGVMDKDTAQNLMEALAFFLAKRLSVSLEEKDKSARKVNPNRLSALDKDLLKQSLAIVKSFKGFLVRHYRLDMF